MSLSVTRILHAGYIFNTDKHTIWVDPLLESPFSKNCYAFPEVKFDLSLVQMQSLDAVIISHFHDDHLSLKSLNYISLSTPIYLYSVHSVFFDLLKDLGFQNVHSLQLNKTYVFGDMKVTSWPALDRQVDCLLQVQTGDCNVLNVVDSWIDFDTLEELRLKTWDLILWPFQTMREIDVLAPSRAIAPSRSLPSEWLEQIKMLSPKTLVPSSCQFKFEEFSWYNEFFFPISYEQFSFDITRVLPAAQVFKLHPGCGLKFYNHQWASSKPLPWISTQGSENYDYDFNESLIIPSLSEMAPHFRKLGDVQKLTIEDFCKNILPSLLTENFFESTYYFDGNRHWELKVIAENGIITSYFYLVGDSRCQLLNAAPDTLDWQTQIIEAKLFAALYEGESLISLYLRINDLEFTSQVEQRLSDHDCLEDPLLYALYSADIAHYQRRQLQELKLANDLRTLNDTFSRDSL